MARRDDDEGMRQRRREREDEDTASLLENLGRSKFAEARKDTDDAMEDEAMANILAGIKGKADVTRAIISEINSIRNISNYNLDTNQWTTSTNKSAICTEINRIINANLLAGGWDDPYAFANYLHDTGHKYTRLIFRCINSNMAECSEDDMNAVFAATNAPGVFTEEDLNILNRGMRGGNACMQKQVGGTIAIDLILLLRLKDVRTLAAAIQAVDYANVIAWGNSQVNRLSDCLKSFIGVSPGQTYLDVITNQIASIYYQGSAIATDSYGKISAWISSNPAQAIGISAAVVRYRELLSDVGKRALMTLPDLFSTATTAVRSVADLLTTVWRSDAGVALLLMLYYYKENADSVNDYVKTNVAGVIRRLSAAEEYINVNIDLSKKADLNNDLIAMMKGLKDNLSVEAVITPIQLAELARILNNTAKAQVATVKQNMKLKMKATYKETLTAAQQQLDSANDRLYLANAQSVVAELDVKPKKSRGARGGKSRSRKLHTKHPKKSVYSRKAKVAKRSNKKH
jgi:hypothetical protein